LHLAQRRQTLHVLRAVSASGCHARTACGEGRTARRGGARERAQASGRMLSHCRPRGARATRLAVRRRVAAGRACCRGADREPAARGGGARRRSSVQRVGARWRH
jgi:hypothetical protein